MHRSCPWGPVPMDSERHLVNLSQLGPSTTVALTHGHPVSACSPPGMKSSLLNMATR